MWRNMKLSNNSLCGSIPIQIGNLLKLSFIDLSYNFINGTKPSQLVVLPILIFLFLSNNNLSSTIPGLFKPIRYLNLSYNDLEGEVLMSLQYVNNPQVFIGNNCLRSRLSGLLTCSTSSTPTTSTKLLRNCIGTGGYGSVYKAMLPTHKIISLKKLH